MMKIMMMMTAIGGEQLDVDRLGSHEQTSETMMTIMMIVMMMMMRMMRMMRMISG